jgi:hypothetical protein
MRHLGQLQLAIHIVSAPCCMHIRIRMGNHTSSSHSGSSGRTKTHNAAENFHDSRRVTGVVGFK